MAVMTRRVLYRRIDAMREKYGVRGIFDPYDFAGAQGISIARHDFHDPRLRGILVRTGDACGVILRAGLTPARERFYLTHELVHRELHYGEIGSTAFADSGREYQADEGAAELLMPYRDLIPRALFLRRRFLTDRTAALRILAAHYRLDLEIVRRRLRSLQYEIALCRSGVPVSEIVPLSRREQQARGLPDIPFDRRLRPVSGRGIDILRDET